MFQIACGKALRRQRWPRLKIPPHRLVAIAVILFACLCEPTSGYVFTGQRWPINSTVTMQLELGSTDVTLIDGLGTWNNSAADALAIWNQYIDLVKFDWISESTAPQGSPDGYNSVFYSGTIFGEGFGDDTLAVTVVWHNEADYTLETEADVVFNTAQSFNSYRGPLLGKSYDFHRVALHEFGHVLGLAHVYNDPPGQALMEPYITDLDHLAPDDIAGAVFLYAYRITSPPVFTGFVQGTETSFAFTANNNPISFSATGLPPGFRLDPATGRVTGVPLESGIFQVAVTAHGFPRDVSATISIEIGAASITSGNPDSFPVGSSFSYTIIAGNSPTSFSATGLPSGLTLNTKTGVISGVVALSGNYSVAVVAHGGQYDAAGVLNFNVTRAFREMVTQFSPFGNIARTIKDPVRDRLYVLAQFSLLVIDTKNLSEIATISFGPPYFSTDMTISLDGTKLWVLTPYLHAVNLTDLTLLPDIPNGPFGADTVREGANHKLYLATSESLIQVDETTGASTTILSPEPFTAFGKFVEIAPDGKTMFLADKFALPSPISRYDISGATPIHQEERFASGYIFTFTISPDGKLVAYNTSNESFPGEIFTYTLPTANLQAQPQLMDPTTNNGSLSFGSNSSIGYFNAVVLDDFTSFNRVDFINTENGLPFNEWTLGEGGVAFDDGAGTYLFVSAYSTIDVYSLASGALPGVTPAPKSLLNVSTRSVVGIEDNRMIGGFIITGDTAKQMAIRAIGPSLPVENPLANPTLSLYDSSGTLLTSNANWNQNHDQLVSAGLTPWDEHDAGLVTTLAPGSYTVVVSLEDGAGGIGLVELYDLSSDNSGKVANISTRARVGTGNDVLIGGFIIGGGESTNIIARAIGPSLAASNVTGVMLNPVLDLHDGNGVVLASNDDWRSTQEAEIIATHIPPSDDRESAIVVALPPGAYTAIVHGQNDSTGIALVEIYNLDSSAAAK